MFGDDWGKGRREMVEQRQQFESRLKYHQDNLKTSIGITELAADTTMICAHLEMMRPRN
jgi:hypothetical protein